MSGHKKWSEIRRQGTPEEEAEIAAEVRTILRENILTQLRRRNELSQEETRCPARYLAGPCIRHRAHRGAADRDDAPVHRGARWRTDRASEI